MSGTTTPSNNGADDSADDTWRHLLAYIQTTRQQAANAARDAYNSPISTGADFLRGAAAGTLQMPFDAGGLIAPAMGMIAPVGASVLQPLADKTQAWINQSPLGTTSDAGAIGNLMANLLLPVPGGSKLAGGRKLSELAGLIKP